LREHEFVGPGRRQGGGYEGKARSKGRNCGSEPDGAEEGDGSPVQPGLHAAMEGISPQSCEGAGGEVTGAVCQKGAASERRRALHELSGAAGVRVLLVPAAGMDRGEIDDFGAS